VEKCAGEPIESVLGGNDISDFVEKDEGEKARAGLCKAEKLRSARHLFLLIPVLVLSLAFGNRGHGAYEVILVQIEVVTLWLALLSFRLILMAGGLSFSDHSIIDLESKVQAITNQQPPTNQV